MRKVQLLDLGMNVGAVATMFVDVLTGSRAPAWSIHGFEPHPLHYRRCIELFRGEAGVFVHRLGLAGREGRRRLHHAANRVGHSLFDDKVNVAADDYSLIDCVRLSTWLEDNLELEGSINVLKLNIEGAEWEVLSDLVDADLASRFDLFLGTPGAEDDLHKIPSLRDRYDEYRRFLSTNGIVVHRYSDFLPERNFDLTAWLEAALADPGSASPASLRGPRRRPRA